MAEYEVLVGNVGVVFCGYSARKAREEFEAYVDQSRESLAGRAAGERVVLMRDGEPIDEYEPADEYDPPALPRRGRSTLGRRRARNPRFEYGGARLSDLAQAKKDLRRYLDQQNRLYAKLCSGRGDAKTEAAYNMAWANAEKAARNVKMARYLEAR